MIKSRQDISYKPSPERIRGMCKQIRGSWSESERQRRLITAEWTPWRVPEVNLPNSIRDQVESE